MLNLLVHLEGDAQLIMGPTPASTPKVAGSQIAGGGGFGLNYDDETPVRAIDIGERSSILLIQRSLKSSSFRWP